MKSLLAPGNQAVEHCSTSTALSGGAGTREAPPGALRAARELAEVDAQALQLPAAVPRHARRLPGALSPRGAACTGRPSKQARDGAAGAARSQHPQTNLGLLFEGCSIPEPERAPGRAGRPPQAAPQASALHCLRRGTARGGLSRAGSSKVAVRLRGAPATCCQVPVALRSASGIKPNQTKQHVNT